MKNNLKNFTLGFVFGYLLVFAAFAAIIGVGIVLFLLFTWRFPEIITPAFKTLNAIGVILGTFCGFTYKSIAE